MAETPSHAASGSLAVGLPSAFAAAVFSLAASVSLLLAGCTRNPQLVDPDFERLGVIDGVPASPGGWGGDLNEVVGVHDGITPRTGRGMLHFQHTSPGGKDEGSAADVMQLVDLSAYADSVAMGTVTADFSTYFNRVAGDKTTDTEFTVTIRAYDGAATDFRTRMAQPPLASGTTFIYSDSDPRTWEQAQVSLLLPPQTTYLLVVVSAVENVVDDSYLATEFAGHYADGGELRLIVGPGRSTWIVLSFALASLLAIWGWRRSRVSAAK